MSKHEVVGSAVEPGSRRAAPSGAPGPVTSRTALVWWRRPWIAPLVVVCLAFLAFSLPPYVALDVTQSRSEMREGVPFHYPVLIVHIAFGTVALLASCVQVWPWFRQRHRVAHRWVGRIYLFAGVVPGSLTGFVVSALHSQGLTSQVGNFLLSLLWLVTGVAGFRAARSRRFADHRTWMIRGFALTTSIVLNRPWFVLYYVLALPQLHVTYDGDEAAMLQGAAGAAVWSSWVVNLLLAEWWLRRGPRAQRGRPSPGSAGTAGPPSAIVPTTGATRA